MIHLFENNGYCIVLDVNSGAVHSVDKPTYDLLSQLEDIAQEECPGQVLDALPQYDSSLLREIYRELYTLKQEGLLFSPDDYENFSDLMVSAPLKAMCLHVCHDCNLRCRYCFAGQGTYGGQTGMMSEQVAKAAIDFLVRQSGQRHNLEVDFFGGEPLMNADVMKATVAYARSLEEPYHKRFRFTVTTNGVLLNDELTAFFNEQMHNVVLSLDGRREINDAMRPNAGGRGSYESVVPKLQRFVRQRGDKDYYVRGTFTRENLDFAEDVLHLASLGFDQISVEPVICDPSLPFAIRESDLPDIFREYDRLAQIMLQRRKEGHCFHFFHFMIDLEQGPCAIKRLRGCGCGNEYAAVDPQGSVYPCHQFVGKPEWKMGDVLTGEYDRRMKDRFARSTVYAKAECRNCWAKFYCSGGCNANNQQYTGDVLTPYPLTCELEKKRLECALMLQVAAAE